jgi:sodium-coupled neutral amino acid transporter 11
MGDYHNMHFQYNEENKTKVIAPAPNDDDNASHDYHKNTSFSNSPPSAAASPAALSLPRKKSSLLGASSNLVNSIVGAGIIGIPYALRMSGLISGVALLVLVSVLTDKSLRLLIEQASFHPRLKNRNVHTFEELAR